LSAHFDCLVLVLQEFVSICEALELVPEDELEASRQGAPDTFATHRAKKVCCFLLLVLLYNHSHISRIKTSKKKWTN
jgi:hypothetical protein